jgi:cation/acetate symporter
LLLVISSAVSHDLIKSIWARDLSDQKELRIARWAAGGAVVVAGVVGIYPPGFVAQVVAFAFGLAASSFFPVLVLGIFNRRVNKQGAIAGMVSGLLFTALYIVWFRFVDPSAGAEQWWFGISPEGIGSLGMMLNFAVMLTVSHLTPPPSEEVRTMVEELRLPRQTTPQGSKVI